MTADPMRQAYDPAVLRGLLDRVTAAKGPDREIDAEIWWLFADHKDDDRDCVGDVARLGVSKAMDKWWGRDWRFLRDTPPRITRSLDTALAQAMRSDPGEMKLSPSGWLDRAAEILDFEIVSSSDSIGQVARAVIACLLSDRLSALLAQQATHAE